MSKKKKNAEAPDGAAKVISVSGHPRARQSIRRTRARVALAAFGLVLFLSLSSGVPGQEAALRALIAGLIGNLAGYACALAVWRTLIMAELKVAGEKHRERQAAARARAAELIEAERQARAEKAATA
jgi:type VI protein secretion system component VasK